jgi:hypothetical protein
MRQKIFSCFPLDKSLFSTYNIQADGVWRSLVSRLVRDQEASGSNPDTPTIEKSLETQWVSRLFPIYGLFSNRLQKAKSAQKSAQTFQKPLIAADTPKERV